MVVASLAHWFVAARWFRGSLVRGSVARWLDGSVIRGSRWSTYVVLLRGSNGSVGFVARFWFVSMSVASMVRLARWFGGSWFEVVDVCGVGLWF